MAKVQIKGPIVSSDVKWIYDWFGIDATSPKDVSQQITDANGEDLEVEINSGGGDVYAGSEIYTALKGHVANVTTRIVGLAASAASVVAMSGKKVMMTPTGQFMIHNVSSRAQGDYRDLEHSAEVLKNHNVSIANAYMLKTGMNQDDLLELMNQETWLNAQQAKEYGFVDEIMFDDNNQLVASVNSIMLPPEVINKMRNSIKGPSPIASSFISSLATTGDTAENEAIIPQNSGLINKQQPAQPQPVNLNKEEVTLEIKNTDELRQHFPDLVAQVENAAKEEGKAEGKKEGLAEGAKNERERIQAIDEIGNTVAPDLVNKAKYIEPMDAKDLAFESLKADAGKGRQYLENTTADNTASGANNLTAQPQLQQTTAEEKEKKRGAAANTIANFLNKGRE